MLLSICSGRGPAETGPKAGQAAIIRSISWSAEACSFFFVGSILSPAAAPAASLAAAQAAAASFRIASIGPLMLGTCAIDVISGSASNVSACAVSPARRNHSGVCTRTSALSGHECAPFFRGLVSPSSYELRN